MTKKKANEIVEMGKENMRKELTGPGLGSIIGLGAYLEPYLLTLVLLCISAMVLTDDEYSEHYPATTCKPIILDSTRNKDIFRYIECETSSCYKVSKIIFEKTFRHSPKEFTPVFEGNTIYSKTLNGVNGYTLEHRNNYHVFNTKHLLYIDPLTKDDTGKWRCVAYEDTFRKSTSNEIRVTFYESACQPKIEDSTSYQHAFKKIECEISTCENVSKIMYMKTIKHNWTPVYEGVNNTYFYPLYSKVQNYSLKDRAEYASFPIKHVLYIDPKKLGDQGEWKCVVYDDKNVTYESKPIAVDIYEQPSGNPLAFVPINPSLVTGQTAEFTCIAYLIHPQPDVIWKVNGVQQARGHAQNQQRDDGLWIVMNGIIMRFNNTGVHNLSCVLKTRLLDPWMMQTITIDVKEPARISDPSESLHIKASINETLTLNCAGSGHKPRITWQRDGEDIPDTDPRYTTKQTCDATTCIGLLKVQLPDANRYSVVYTCVISLTPPYQSTQNSHYINVYIPNANRLDGPLEINVWKTIGTALLIFTFVASIIGVVKFLMIKNRQKSCTDGSSEPMVNRT